VRIPCPKLRTELTLCSAWIPNTDLTPLEPEQCKDVSEKGKAKSLVEAYKVASEGHDLKHFKEMLYEHDRATREDERLRAEFEAEKAAEKAAKADKKKRKPEVKVDDDVEMEDAEEAPKKSSKKRKKGTESDDEQTEKVCDSCHCDAPGLIRANSLQRLPRQQRSS